MKRVTRAHLPAIAVAVTAVVFAGAALVQAAHRTRRPPCSPTGSYTIYQDTAIRVYRRIHGVEKDEDDYACLFSVGKRRRIASFSDSFGGEAVDLIRAQRPWIAYSLLGDTKPGGAYGRVCVLNLRSGDGSCHETDDYGVDGLGLTRAGSIAWMDYHSDPPGYARAVHKLDAGTDQPVVLDSDKDIDRTSFGVGGHFIYWTKSGKPHSARMP